MPERRTTTSVQLLERIDRYLEDSGLAGANPRVVPLTGDASDRRYFRVIPADGPSIVLALHAGPIDFASLPFAQVAELFQALPLPVPAILGHCDELGILALQDLGDVTLQAHLGASSATEHAALYREGVSLTMAAVLGDCAAAVCAASEAIRISVAVSHERSDMARMVISPRRGNP